MNLGTLGSLFIDMAANTATFETDLGRAAKLAEKRSKEMQESFLKAGEKILAAYESYKIGERLVESVSGAIEQFDNLGKAAQKVGVGTERLSELRFAAKLADTDFESLTGGLEKFNKAQVDARNGGKEQLAAFQALGISLRDLKTLSPDQLLTKATTAFAATADNADKTRIAMALFGKTGADLIPFLNQGAKGIAELSDEAHKLHATISEEAAKSAEEFNDNLTRLKTGAEGVANIVAERMLPTLLEFSAKAVAAAEDADNLDRTARSLEAGFKVVATMGLVVADIFNEVGTLIGGIAAASERFGQGMNKWDAIVPGKFFLDAVKNAKPAADILVDSIKDADQRSTQYWQHIEQIWQAGSDKLGKLGSGVDQKTDWEGKPLPKESNKPSLHFNPEAAGDAEKALKQQNKEIEESRKEIEAHAQALAGFHQTIDEIVGRAADTGNQALDQYNASILKINRTFLDAEKSGLSFAETQRGIAAATAEATKRFEDQTALFRQNFDEETKRFSSELMLDPFKREIAQALEEYEEAKRELDRLRKNGSINDQEYNQRLGLLGQRRDQGVQNANLGQSFQAHAFGVTDVQKLTQAMHPFQDAAAKAGDVFNSALQHANDSMASLLANMILFGNQGGMSAKQVAKALEVDLVTGLIKVGLQMAENYAIGLIFGKATSLATATEAAAAVVAWTPAATAASIASFGAADAAGLAAFSAAMASGAAIGAGFAATAGAAGIASRRYGGPVSAGGMYEAAEPGNPELLRYGNRQFLMMPHGSGDGFVTPLKAMQGTGSGGGNITIHNYSDLGVQATRRSDGDTDIVIGRAMQGAVNAARSAVASDVKNPTSPTSRNLKSTHGTRPRALV